VRHEECVRGIKITYRILDEKSQGMTLLGRTKRQLKGTIKKDII